MSTESMNDRMTRKSRWRTFVFALSVPAFVAGSVLAGASAPTQAEAAGDLPFADGPVGWASAEGGTTGGAGGETVPVSSAEELDAALQQTGPAIIEINGVIQTSGMHEVTSNKTIIGTGADSGISGGGLTLSEVDNVIIRNLNFSNADDDSINIEESSTHVWIDHNSLTNAADGLIDIKRGSDFITVSWNHTFEGGKSMLLGHSDDNAEQDVGHLRVTYHHNFFDGTDTRHPRVRFGNPVHVYNNYYSNNEYGVASTMDAGVLVEGNFFEAVEEPTLVGYADSEPGTLVQRDNVFQGSGQPQAEGEVNPIPYEYTLDSAEEVKNIVSAGAGAGKIGL